MKKPNRIARKGDTARHRAQTKTAPSADQTKARTRIRDEAVCYGPNGEDLRKDREGYYVIEQGEPYPLRRVTREQALQWFLDCGYVPDEFREGLGLTSGAGQRGFDWEIVLKLETEVRATNALLALFIAQLMQNPSESIADPTDGGACAAGIADLIHERRARLSAAFDAVAAEAQCLNGTPASSLKCNKS